MSNPNLTISLVLIPAARQAPKEVARFSNEIGCGPVYAAAGALARILEVEVQIWSRWGEPNSQLMDTIKAKGRVNATPENDPNLPAHKNRLQSDSADAEDVFLRDPGPTPQQGVPPSLWDEYRACLGQVRARKQQFESSPWRRLAARAEAIRPLHQGLTANGQRSAIVGRLGLAARGVRFLVASMLPARPLCEDLLELQHAKLLQAMHGARARFLFEQVTGRSYDNPSQKAPSSNPKA